MNKLADFIVRFRYQVLGIMLALAAFCALLMPRVTVVTDMTTYLPDASSMKKGIDIMKEEFSDFSISNTIRVMFTDLPEEEKEQVLAELRSIEFVSGVDYIPKTDEYDKDGRTLYVVNTTYDFSSPEMNSIEAAIRDKYTDYCGMVYHLDNSATNSIPLWIVLFALALVVTILVLMSPSFIEPVLYLVTIGIAIVINMGTNILLGSVSQTTHAIGSLLQLILSIDYSIMLSEHYRAARKDGRGVSEAMKKALPESFRPVTGSSATTVAGMLTMCFMSFKIGADLGCVLAKGVVISLLCVFTVLPVLIMICDPLINKTQKPVLHLPLDGLGRFSSRYAKWILVFFAVLVCAVFYFKGNTKITYTLPTVTEIDEHFTRTNSVIVLYDNRDEEKILDLSKKVEKSDNIKSVLSYSGIVERKYTADDLGELTDHYGMGSLLEDALDNLPIKINADNALILVLNLYNAAKGREPGSGVTIVELMEFVSGTILNDPIYGNLIPSVMKDNIPGYMETIQNSADQLKGKNYSLMVVQTKLPDESPETMAFLKELHKNCTEMLDYDYYMIGNSPMAYEISQTFKSELNRITIITAAAIFVVVLLTFRALLLPLLLVVLIQTAVYITVVLMGFQGQSMYYLAFLIVQSILMGATIDYAILFTNYYRESRGNEDIRGAVTHAYERAVPTILTSGLIIIIATAILGYAFEDPSIGQICHTIAKGTTASLVMVILVLPGLLCASDRVVKKKK